jgi:hypothetical protein
LNQFRSEPEAFNARALVLFSGVGYLIPRPEGLDPFYYWTRGIPLVLAMIGLACLVSALLWTAVVLCIYA